ncbi:alpha/beta fold hydrolase [Deinococcus xianganensis]|uniref:Alpha/beta fold hydrolase n=1 Tax=Deinococcus xianganensis TaxID=1507289 RepID=A0A6I4YQF8_9DEIO|nr:alpha/beta fold hydrolase [Deinococcus xianganensis]MXV19785.1 alpha/beta fold hydrolase [Deinococcus xianganensis]
MTRPGLPDRSTRDVLLLHGAFLSGASWSPVVGALGPQVNVHAPDLPGHGRTAVPPAWTVASMAEVVARDLMRPVHVCGHSLGGMVALQLALSAPHLVASLTMVESSAGTNDTPLNRLGTRLGSVLMRAVPVPALASLFAADLAGPDPALREEVRRSVLRYRSRRSDLLGIWNAVAAFDAWSHLHRVSVPTLIVTGASNTRTAPHARQLQAAIPGAQGRVIPGAGHLLPQQQPVRLAHLLGEFWNPPGC